MFSSRMEGIELSGLRQMFEMAADDSVNLGLGEPDFQPPEVAVEAVQEAMRMGMNKYGPTTGILPLREEISRTLKAYWSDIGPDNVVVTSSGSQALFSGALTFLDRGQKALVPDPGFVLYRPHAKLCGAEPVGYPLTIDNGFRPDMEGLEKMMDERTRLLVVNSPSNPTGAIFTRQDRDDIVDLAREKDIIIISDEVYDTMIYSGASHSSFLGVYEKAVMINSFSKMFAMTGWRMGYLAASDELIGKLKLAHYHMVACPPTPIQYGVLAALLHAKDFVGDMVSEFQKRRDTITKRVNEIHGFRAVLPAGTFYSFPQFDLKKGNERVSSGDLAMELARKGLICSPGSTFGQHGEYHLRFSFVNTRKEIGRGMDILEDTIDGLS